VVQKIQEQSKERQKKQYLYHGEVSDLKSADQKGRILRGLVFFVINMLLLLSTLLLFGPYSIIAYIIALFFLFPTPIIIVPTEYKIVNNGIIHRKGKVIPMKRIYKLRVNSEKKFVSVDHPGFKGEFLRLYSAEPETVLNLLKDMKSK